MSFIEISEISLSIVELKYFSEFIISLVNSFITLLTPSADVLQEISKYLKEVSSKNFFIASLVTGCPLGLTSFEKFPTK